MTRYLFGGTTYDVVVSEDATNVGTETTPRKALAVAPASTAVALYDAPGGTLQSDFLLWDGSAYTIPATSITTGSDGFLPAFKGPDGKTVLYDAAGHAIDARDASTGGTGLPNGGTTGQALLKNSSTDGDANWGDLPSADWNTLANKPTISSFVLSILNAADAGAFRSLIGAAADSTAVKTTGNQTIAGIKTFSSAPVVPDGAFDPSKVNDFEGAVDDHNISAGVLHGLPYNEGDPLPTSPGNGRMYETVKVSAPTSLPTFTQLNSTPGSSTDGTSWTITLSRAFAAGTYAVAFVDLATTGTTPGLPTTITGGGLTWTIPNDAGANPLSGTTTDGKQGMAMYIATGTPSGTSLTLTAASAMQGAAWSIVEVANGGTAKLPVKSASSVSATPSLSVPGVTGTDRVLVFMGQNTATDVTALGSGLTEVGTLQVAPGTPPAASIKTAVGIGTGTVGFTAANSASKRIMAVVVPTL